MYKAAQILGVVSGISALALWTLVIWSPDSLLNLTPASMGVGMAMLLLSMFGVVAAIRMHGGVMIVIFVISFLPVGLYLIGVPHWIRWIGIANVGFLLAGLILLMNRPLSATTRE